jgi:hypothetical protein
MGAGTKGSLYLQSSKKQLSEQREAYAAKAPEDSDEEEDDDGMEEDTSRTEREGSPSSESVVSVQMADKADSDSPDSDESVHRPGHALYTLLHQEGDPALKLPALSLPAKIAAAQAQSSTMLPSSPTSTSAPDDSLYPDLSSLASKATASSPLPSLSSLTQVVVSPPSTPGSDLSSGVRKIGLSESPRPAPASTGYSLYPSLPTAAAAASASGQTEKARPKVSFDDRLRHAALIRSILVYINTEYVKKLSPSNSNASAYSSSYSSYSHSNYSSDSREYTPRGRQTPLSPRTPLQDAMELDSPIISNSVSSAA